jgi:hypothetical protein
MENGVALLKLIVSWETKVLFVWLVIMKMAILDKKVLVNNVSQSG